MDLAIVTTVLSYVAYFMGFFRLVVKPLMELVKNFVKDSDTVKDDELLDSVVGSSVYKWAIWLIDYFTSIKVPLTKKAVVKAMKK